MRVDIPKNVKGAQRRVWRELAPVVGGRLSVSTAHSFAQLCASIVAHREITDAVSAMPVDELVIEHSNGALGLNPLERVRTQRSAELRGLLKDWGLTPATADVAGDCDNDERELADFLAEGERLRGCKSF